MTCRHVSIGGVRAILCDRRAPPKIHAFPPEDCDPATLCRLATGLRTSMRRAVTCKRCRALLAKSDETAAAVARLTAPQGTP